MRKIWSVFLPLGILLSIIAFQGSNAVFAEDNSFTNELATITVERDTKIYSEPDQSSKGLAYVMEGDSVQQIAVSDDWIQVIWENNYGYILCSDIENEIESEGSVESPQEAILDEYFDAVNDLDRTRISDLCNNESKVNNAANSSDVSNYDYFIQRLQFLPGLLGYASYSELSDENTVAIFKGYGYKGNSANEIRNSFQNDIDGDGKILFSDLHTSYELLDLKRADECKNYYMSGLNKIYIPDIKEQMKNDLGVECIDDVYVAKIKIYR